MKSLPIWLLCLLLLVVSCKTQPTPEQQLLTDTTRHVILPALQRFSDSTQALVTSSEQFCEQQGQKTAQDLAQLQDNWRKSMNAWQAAKIIPFGPISIDNQSWKIQFWPDKHNLVRRKLQALLDGEDALDVERIAKASVLTQGLTALEYLLFDEQGGHPDQYQSTPKGQRQCQLLIAVSQHTHKVAAGLNEAWQPEQGNYAAILTKPGEQNPTFTDSNSAIAALVDALVATTEAAKGGQLAQPLGYKSKGDRPRPYMSEAWRSRYSTQAVAANLQAAKLLYSGGTGYGMDDYLRSRNQKVLAEKINAQFDTVLTTVSQAPAIFDAVTDKQQRQVIEQIYQDLKILVGTLKNELPPAMGVQLGFNSNDGD
ncbi:MAG: imelysin family protein [Porticoccaceae bacterium]|nr:imelysin family protein [Pseudomonadales bacterium]MCP5170824.1 imelysin family protein [Pseudomonadales bacterium]